MKHPARKYSAGRLRLQLKPATLMLALLVSMVCAGQEKKRIDIERADSFESNKAIVANAQRLIGKVQIRHNDVLMWCDSAYAYTGTNKVDAFGNVHINQGDTTHLYAQRIFYNGDIGQARAWIDVRLEKRTTTLYTDTLDYDLNTNIAYYDDKGKIVDSLNILTSQIGQYHVKEDIVYFYKDVEAHNKKYTLVTDTLKYNTVTGKTYILGPTTIKDSTNTLYAEDGWYNSSTGEAELLKNPVVNNGKQKITGKKIEYLRENGLGKAFGKVEINDFENKILVKGEKALYDKDNKVATVTDSAQLIIYSETDSLFLHADTLKTIPDTIEDAKIFKAYHGVRFFRDNLQGVCDSLNYFSKDSTAELHYSPVLWSENRQMTARYIKMKSNENSPDEVHLNDDAYIISQLDSAMYDQVKGKTMIGYIVNNELDKIDVDGNGQSLYYAEDKNGIIGLNRSECSKITIRFKEGKIFRISLLSEPEGDLKPLPQLEESEKLLKGFSWKPELRPSSKTDIFRK